MHSFGIRQRLTDAGISCGDIESIFAYAKAFAHRSMSPSTKDIMILDNVNKFTLDDIDISNRQEFMELFLLPWAGKIAEYMTTYEELMKTKPTEQSKDDLRVLSFELQAIKLVFQNVSCYLADTMIQKHFKFSQIDIIEKLDCKNIDDMAIIMETFKHIFQSFELLDEHGCRTMNLVDVKDFSISLNLMQAIKFSTQTLTPLEMTQFETVRADVVSWVNGMEDVIRGMAHIRDIIETPFKQASVSLQELDDKVNHRRDLVSIIDAVFLSMRDNDTIRSNVRTFCSERMSNLMVYALDIIEPLPMCTIDKVYLVLRFLVTPFLRKHQKTSEIKNPLVSECVNVLINFCERNDLKDDLTNSLMTAFFPMLPRLMTGISASFLTFSPSANKKGNF